MRSESDENFMHSAICSKGLVLGKVEYKILVIKMMLTSSSKGATLDSR